MFCKPVPSIIKHLHEAPAAHRDMTATWELAGSLSITFRPRSLAPASSDRRYAQIGHCDCSPAGATETAAGAFEVFGATRAILGARSARLVLLPSGAS